MRKKIVTFILLIILILPIVVLAEECPIKINGDVLTLDNKTAVFDFDTNTLTLDNYDDGPIIYSGTNTLNIILKGENKITSDYYSAGFSSDSTLIFSGEGSLILENVLDGIYISDGNLNINSNITINNILRNGIKMDNGNVIIDSILSMNDDLDIREQDFSFAPNYQAINIEGGNIKVNNDVTINNAGKAFLTNEKVIINSGKTNVKTLGTAIDCEKGFDIIDGILDIEISSDEYNLDYGISSLGDINIMGGTLHIKVPENDIPISVNSYTNELPEFNISDDVIMKNNTYDLQETVVDDYFYIKTYGLEGYKIDFDFEKGYIITNGISEITFKKYTYKFIEGEEQKFTEQNINKYVFIIDGDFNLFKNITIEGLELIKNIDYLVTEGSTIIEFTDKGIEKINTLKEGIYDVKANYTNNKTVISKLIIEKDKITTKEENNINTSIEKENKLIEANPKTGDSIVSNILFSFISLTTFGVLLKFYKKRKFN